MMFLYDARSSVVLLSPKNKVKLPTHSAGKWICTEKCEFKILAKLFLKNEKASNNRTCFTQCVHYHSPSLKRFH